MRRLLCGLVAVGLVVGEAGDAKADLLVASGSGGQVLRYDDKTGAFLGIFAQGLPGDTPVGMTVGPDRNLYVGTGFEVVSRFNGQTGAFIDRFASGRGLIEPGNLTFGPDGNLYVASFGGISTNSSILRYNGATGTFINAFVPVGSGGLAGAEGLVFGPDRNLYVTSRDTNQVLRYDGLTGASLGVFAKSSGNNGPIDLVFGPDGNLYVLDNLINFAPGSLKVERFNGSTGAFMDVFVDSFIGGTDDCSLAFGPDGNLYVTTGFVGNSVVRFDGLTGRFLGEFVTSGSGGLDSAGGLLFATPVPEPSTLLLLGIGTLGLIGWAWRRRKIASESAVGRLSGR